jgi:DNA repair protein RecN (Recombination protein N)
MANRSISSITRLASEYEAIADKIESLAIEADDVAELLSNMGDELYFDENEAEETESRLDSIRSLKRKYGANKKEIDEYLLKIRDEYELLSDCEGKFAVLTDEKEKTEKKIFSICQEITQLRKTQGQAFCSRVIDELKTLNILHANFDIQFEPYSFEDVDNATVSGLDSICFLFSANAGEPMKPLGKIISGGEMSRFMLAVKTQLSEVNEISTYIFDEIDAGISGKTAKVVGEKLARIATNTQIIAVSHLAQIAVMSDAEFLIEKREKDEKTLTYVTALDDLAKKREIVRLLGGENTDEYATKHAEELLKQAKEYKNTLS